MKEFVIWMLAIGFLFVLGLVGLWDALSRLSNGTFATQEMGSVHVALAVCSALTISSPGFAVYCVIHHLKLRRSQRSSQ